MAADDDAGIQNKRNCADGLHPCHPRILPACAQGRRKEKVKRMFAVIKNGGRQYKVSVGQKLEVNRLPVEAGSQISIAEVLLISDAEQTRIGAPFVENAAVLATVEGDKRGEKLTVFRYKSKKRFRHRR